MPGSLFASLVVSSLTVAYGSVKMFPHSRIYGWFVLRFAIYMDLRLRSAGVISHSPAHARRADKARSKAPERGHASISVGFCTGSYGNYTVIVCSKSRHTTRSTRIAHARGPSFALSCIRASRRQNMT